MSQIFVIAGPPGIGKSTSGYEFVDPELEILNEDEMAYPDYKEQAIHRLTQTIRTKLIRNEDFALELNLGYPEHYDYVLSAKKFRDENTLHVILYYTDDLEICIERAKLRFESGRHLVKPETIREMYVNTIPLLQANLGQIDSLSFVDGGSGQARPIATYDCLKNKLALLDSECAWFNEKVYPIINGR
jgi:predicted ABC-type ATPase